jgi:hypothetical protein
MGYSREIMDELGRTEGLLHKGLKEINDKGELTAQSLEVLGETLDGIKDLYEIKGKGHDMIEEYGYPERPYRISYRRDGDGDGRYYENRGYMYEGNVHTGNSYGYNGNSYGYSGDSYLDELHRKMENAKSEQEREVIRGMIRDHEKR